MFQYLVLKIVKNIVNMFTLTVHLYTLQCRHTTGQCCFDCAQGRTALYICTSVGQCKELIKVVIE